MRQKVLDFFLSNIHDSLVLPSLSEIPKDQKTEPENTSKSFQIVLKSKYPWDTLNKHGPARHGQEILK